MNGEHVKIEFYLTNGKKVDTTVGIYEACGKNEEGQYVGVGEDQETLVFECIEDFADTLRAGIEHSLEQYSDIILQSGTKNYNIIPNDTKIASVLEIGELIIPIRNITAVKVIPIIEDGNNVKEENIVTVEEIES